MLGWRRLSVAASLDGYILFPMSESACPCTPAAGAHGRKGTVVLISCLWVSRRAHVLLAGWLAMCEQNAGLDGPLV